MPALDLETLVIDGVRQFLGDAGRVHDAITVPRCNYGELNSVLELAALRAADPGPSVHRDLISASRFTTTEPSSSWPSVGSAPRATTMTHRS